MGWVGSEGEEKTFNGGSGGGGGGVGWGGGGDGEEGWRE